MTNLLPSASAHKFAGVGEFGGGSLTFTFEGIGGGEISVNER